MIVLSLFLLAGSAQAGIINRMTLRGGNGDTFGVWVPNHQSWSCPTGGGYILGVSKNPGSEPTYGPLLNKPDTSIDIPAGVYYLYAEPTFLGNNPKLQVYLKNGTVIEAIFRIVDVSGSGALWTRTDGSPAITLGWAPGVADLVGTYSSMVPSGVNDFYLRTGVNWSMLGAFSVLLLEPR